MKYCENTESCNDMFPLTQYKETLQGSLQVFSKSSFSYHAGIPTTGYLFPYLLQHTLFHLVYCQHDAGKSAHAIAPGSQG
jgi:hypothetical protein